VKTSGMLDTGLEAEEAKALPHITPRFAPDLALQPCWIQRASPSPVSVLGGV
jgi:hypothetical protein